MIFFLLYYTKLSFLFGVSMSQVPETFCCHNLNCRLARRKFSSALLPVLWVSLFVGILIYLQLRFQSFTFPGPLFFWMRKGPSMSPNVYLRNVNSKTNSKSRVEVSQTSQNIINISLIKFKQRWNSFLCKEKTGTFCCNKSTSHFCEMDIVSELHLF